MKPTTAPRDRAPVETLKLLREDVAAVFRISGLSDRERRVLVALLMLVNSWGRDADRITTEQVAQYAGLEVRNARRTLKDLETRGFVGCRGGGGGRGDVPSRWVFVAAIREAAPTLLTGNEAANKEGQDGPIRGVTENPKGGSISPGMGGQADPPPVHPYVSVLPCGRKGGQTDPPKFEARTATATLSKAEARTAKLQNMRAQYLAIFDQALDTLGLEPDSVKFTRNLPRNLWRVDCPPYEGLIRVLAKACDWQLREWSRKPARNPVTLWRWMNNTKVLNAIRTGADFVCSDEAHEQAKRAYALAESKLAEQCRRAAV